MKVITYQAPNGSKIDVTVKQAKAMEAAGVWPKNHRGEDYCQVSHGSHAGEPTYTDEQIRSFCDGMELGIVALEGKGIYEVHPGTEDSLDSYAVVNSQTGAVRADGMTLEDAAEYADELNAIETVLRGVGVFIAPIGVVLGFIPL